MDTFLRLEEFFYSSMNWTRDDLLIEGKKELKKQLMSVVDEE